MNFTGRKRRGQDEIANGSKSNSAENLSDQLAVGNRRDLALRVLWKSCWTFSRRLEHPGLARGAGAIDELRNGRSDRGSSRSPHSFEQPRSAGTHPVTWKSSCAFRPARAYRRIAAAGRLLPD